MLMIVLVFAFVILTGRNTVSIIPSRDYIHMADGYGESMVPTNKTLISAGELDLFSLATNWKFYVKAAIKEYLIGDVLEVGAGIGSTTAAMHDSATHRWICLEPDLCNAKRLKKNVIEQLGFKETHVIAGSLDALAKRPIFDCILYMDVLEHIHHDRDQILAAAQLVRRGGHIVILSPAHQWLFSEFDKSIGHLRRYNKTASPFAHAFRMDTGQNGIF